MTLPDDVIAWLQSLDADAGRAIVSMYERHVPDHAVSEPDPPGPVLVPVGPQRALIVVERATVTGLPGVAAIPLSGNRAFLALEPGQNIAELELAVADALDGLVDDGEARRGELEQLRQALRAWRRDTTLRFRERSIIVVERVRGRGQPAKPGRG